ncbi:TPA: tail fiber domain-containing protein [Citrobacter freundii]|nr:tail fiber domain-containing protein [Citrobacter freundii]
MSNYLISMPANTFSMPRQFKAISNGRIFIGLPDTDPVNPANQIPVYIINESGAEVQVAQPIIINAGGFPVYNGQIAKFVTKQNYSMAVLDSYNAQQFYWPDLALADPATLVQDLAAPGGISLIGPGVMSRGLDKLSIMQGRPGEYLGPDVTHGLGMKLVEPLTGLVDQSNGAKLNFIHIVDDRLNAVDDTFAGTKVDGLQILHSFGGAGCKGGRHAAQFVSSQIAATESTNTDRNYVGVVGWAQSFSGDGGAGSGDDKGGYFGGNMMATLSVGAMNTLNVTGCEFNVSIPAGASTRIRTGLQVGGSGSQQGTVIDAGLSVGNKTGAVTWRNGIRIGNHNGGEALGTGSKAIVAVASSVIQAGIDLPATSLYVLTSGNATIYDYGAAFETTNAHIKLGSPSSASTTYIDFNTSALNATYDSRIIASAGTATTGAGTMQVIAGVLALQASTEIQFSATLRPTTDNTFDVGTASRRGRTAYFGTGTINTSDDRHKPIKEETPDSVLDAWQEINWGTRFKFDDAIAEKGEDGARWHFGLIAQRVEEVFSAHGINGFTLGLLCYDEWEDRFVKVCTNEGATVTKTRVIQEGVEVKKVRTIKRPVMIKDTRDVLVDDVLDDGTRIKRIVTEEYERQLTEQIPVLMADGSPNPHQPYVTEVVTEEVEEEYFEMELIDVIEEYTEPAEPEYTDVLDIVAGSRYGIRYEEALSLEAALQRRNYGRMKEKYENLAARIEALESK